MCDPTQEREDDEGEQAAKEAEEDGFDGDSFEYLSPGELYEADVVITGELTE